MAFAPEVRRSISELEAYSVRSRIAASGAGTPPTRASKALSAAWASADSVARLFGMLGLSSAMNGGTAAR